MNELLAKIQKEISSTSTGSYFQLNPIFRCEMDSIYNLLLIESKTRVLDFEEIQFIRTWYGLPDRGIAQSARTNLSIIDENDYIPQTKKDARGAIRCSKGQIKRWEVKAQTSGLTLSKWICFAANLNKQSVSAVGTYNVVPERNKTERIAFRCSQQEIQAWKKIAQRQGISLSQWLARKCDELAV